MRKHKSKQVVGLDAHSVKLELSIWEEPERFNLRDSKPIKKITGELKDLENIFKKHTEEGAQVVLEASTNSFSISERLRKIGRVPFIVKSETVSKYQPPYKINDTTDAANLARAHLAGYTEEVYQPSKRYLEYRSLFVAYKQAVVDKTRCSNRIWNFCSAHNLPLPKNFSLKKGKELQESLRNNTQLGVLEKSILNCKLNLYFDIMSLIREYERQICYIVLSNKDMKRLLKVLGMGPITVFAIGAFIEDIERFENYKKLAAYFGLVPTINESGKEEGSHHTTHVGRKDVKTLLIEGAKSAMIHGKSPVHKWARGLAVRKNHNLAAVALARKMLTFVWHILKGHEIVFTELPQGIEEKVRKMAVRIGVNLRTKLGCKTALELCNYVIREAVPKYTPK